MKTIYLISGLAGSGKSTVGTFISETLGIQNFSLSDSLKEIMVDISNLFGQKLKLEDLYDVVEKTKYRKQMQILGTDILRNKIDEDVFNKLLEKKVDKTKSFVIDDLRFINEYEYWKDFAKKYNYEVKTFNISRPSTTLRIDESNHISENLKGIDFDFVIFNNGTKEELLNDIRKLI